MQNYDVVIIGGGPAGLTAALKAFENNMKVLIIEREERAGGILKQCIHDGFGILRFNERLTGPEYAAKFLKEVEKKHISILCSTFVIKIKEKGAQYILHLVNEEKGVFTISTKTLILAAGCRERTSKQIFIHGNRPAGVYTAGTAQYFVNILGYLPCKKCIILGSGDIGLIMARRLTLEGAEVVGVYEVKDVPSGLTRNIVQCLEDYNIPLYLSHTIIEIHGADRVESVTIAQVDKNMVPINGTEKEIECDGVILSVGLIPENELARLLDIEIDTKTRGPYVDQNLMTLKDGVFSCGNALHVNDLVDYVSESGDTAGQSAADYIKIDGKNKKRNLIPIQFDSNQFLYVVPQYIDINSVNKKVYLYFRSKYVKQKVKVKINYNNKTIINKKYKTLKPPEMEKVILDFKDVKFTEHKSLEMIMEGD